MSIGFSEILRFYSGEPISSISNFHRSKKTIRDIYTYNQRMLEENDDFIEWIFPIPTLYEIKKLKEHSIVFTWLKIFKYKMFEYWGISPKNEINAVLLNGHNGLKLCRAIECLTLFGINIDKEMDVLKQLIIEGVVFPRLTKYENDLMPIWSVKQKEAEKLIFYT